MAYYKVRMKDRNTFKCYHAYISAFDEAEARKSIKYELLDEEQEDIVDAVIKISKEEYEEGYKRFGDGERS